MTKYISISIASIALTSLIWWSFNKPQTDNSYLDTLKVKDSIIKVKDVQISKLYNQIKLDSINYEEEINNISKLRNSYPNDAIIDSLFIAGQSMR